MLKHKHFLQKDRGSRKLATEKREKLVRRPRHVQADGFFVGARLAKIFTGREGAFPSGASCRGWVAKKEIVRNF